MLILTFEYPPQVGGISTLCAAIAKGLNGLKYPVSVLTQSNLEKQQREFEDHITCVSSRRPIREFQSLIKLWSERDLVIAGLWYPEALLAQLAGCRPLIVLAHGQELMPPKSAWRRPIWGWLQNKVLSSADLVIANSTYTEKLVRKSAPASRVVTITLAVDHNHFVPGDRLAAREKFGVAEKRVITTVARIVKSKGHDVVIRALAGLDPTLRKDFVYLVAGSGPDRQALEQKACSLGITPNVHFLGHVADVDLPDLYRATDLFVLCSRESLTDRIVEGFGLVLLEAQSSGTPVLATRSGGIPDAVNYGKGGWLIDEEDVEGLRSKLVHLVEEPEVFAEEGRVARTQVEAKHTWEKYIYRLIKALDAHGISLS